MTSEITQQIKQIIQNNNINEAMISFYDFLLHPEANFEAREKIYEALGHLYIKIGLNDIANKLLNKNIVIDGNISKDHYEDLNSETRNSIIKQIETAEDISENGSLHEAIEHFYNILAKNNLDNKLKARVYNNLGCLFFRYGIADLVKIFFSLAKEYSHDLEDIEANEKRFNDIIAYSDYIRVINDTDNINSILNSVNEQLDSRPLKSVGLEITGTCNLNCIMCPRRNAPKEMLNNVPYDKIKNILDQVCPYTKTITFGGLGEPLIHPDFKKIVTTIKNYGCLIAFSSNGLLFDNAEMCDFLIKNVDSINVSIDASTEDTYKKVRGGDFNKLRRGLLRLKEKKIKLNSATPKLNTKFTVMKLNYREINEFLELRYDLGIEGFSLGHVICSDDEMYRNLAIYNDKKLMEEYLELLENHNLKQMAQMKKPAEKYIQCPFPCYNSLYIRGDGTITICCHASVPGSTKYFDDEEPYVVPEITFGNIYEEPLIDIWQKEEYKAYRYGIAKGEPYGFCQKCICARGMFI